MDMTYGCVVANPARTQVLLRRVVNSFGGVTWTFAKGHPNRDEEPLECALREAKEEYGVSHLRVIQPLSGVYEGSTTVTKYWLCSTPDTVFTPDSETSELKWAAYKQAQFDIACSANVAARERDLTVLKVAFRALSLF